MSDRLYPDLDAVSNFVHHVGWDDPPDAPGIRAAIARYIGELPGSDFFDMRHDWRSFAKGIPVDRPGKA